MMYAALCKPPPLYAWGNDSFNVTVLTVNKGVNMIILLSCEQEKPFKLFCLLHCFCFCFFSGILVWFMQNKPILIIYTDFKFPSDS